MKRVAIAGVTGYAGIELVRILGAHPGAELTYLAGRSRVGEAAASALPSLADRVPAPGTPAGTVRALDAEAIAAEAEVVFLALPHGASMAVVPALLEHGLTVVDLSADFRLSDVALYEEWYVPHEAPALLERAVYGLPELFRDALPGATLVASPGCYPTAAILSLAPLLRGGWVEVDDLVVDSKSGASGAGRAPAVGTLLAEAGESTRAYKVASHRHAPEMEHVLGRVRAAGATGGGAEAAVRVTFTPHLVPMARGILSTAYARLARPLGADDLQGLYEQAYADEPFVRVLPPDRLPETAHVRGSNLVDVAVRLDDRPGGPARVIVVAAIDNLVKGAAGQAVQAMNVALGLDERTGLGGAPVFP